MPNRAPTHREREVLRYLAAGMRLELWPSRQSARVVVKGVTVTTLRANTVRDMAAAGWLGEHPERGYFLTLRGRDVAECGAFVRAFSESTQFSTPSTPST